jgi:hypothetical protein
MTTSPANKCNELMTAVVILNNSSRDICNTDRSYNGTNNSNKISISKRENCIMKSFIICTLHQILLRCSNKGR